MGFASKIRALVSESPFTLCHSLAESRFGDVWVCAFLPPPRFTPTALTSAHMLRVRGRQIAHETINTQPWPCLKLLVRFYCRHLQQCLDWNGEHGEMHQNGLGCGIAASNFKPVYVFHWLALALWVPLFCPQCLVDAPRSLKRLGMKLQWRTEATR